MTEEKINDAGVFIEPFGGGFIIADYSSELALFAGISLNWRSQPIVSDPFPTRDDALAAAAKRLEANQ